MVAGRLWRGGWVLRLLGVSLEVVGFEPSPKPRASLMLLPASSEHWCTVLAAKRTAARMPGQGDMAWHGMTAAPPQFSSLEPEIVCRLVFVREVQFTGPPGTRGGAMGTDGIAAGVAAAAAGEPAGDVQPQAQQQGGGQASGSTASAGAGGAAGPPSTPPGGPGKQGQGAGTSSGGANASSDSTNAGQGQASAAGGGGCGASGHVHHSHTHTHLGTELPTCPVCLERLDEHVSGIVTTVCNHQFHSECLQQWGDTSCPVCRWVLSVQAYMCVVAKLWHMLSESGQAASPGCTRGC